MQSRFTDLSIHPEDLGHAMLDGILQPIIALDSERRILLKNRCAQDLLRAGSALREYTGNRLHACAADDDALLGDALAQLPRGERERWSIRLQHGGQSMSLQLRRLRCASPVPLASLTVLDSAAELRADALALAFGLTPAEARVAGYLAQGLAPKKVAEICGVSTCTVRSQVRTLFVKTGARRQPELVRMVLLASTF
jgi:DNA-binding CsgD family transcriptional regulator